MARNRIAQSRYWSGRPKLSFLSGFVCWRSFPSTIAAIRAAIARDSETRETSSDSPWARITSTEGAPLGAKATVSAARSGW